MVERTHCVGCNHVVVSDLGRLNPGLNPHQQYWLKSDERMGLRQLVHSGGFRAVGTQFGRSFPDIPYNSSAIHRHACARRTTKLSLTA
jgi:hypothetical protein